MRRSPSTFSELAFCLPFSSRFVHELFSWTTRLPLKQDVSFLLPRESVKVRFRFQDSLPVFPHKFGFWFLEGKWKPELRRIQLDQVAGDTAGGLDGNTNAGYADIFLMKFTGAGLVAAKPRIYQATPGLNKLPW